MVTDRMYHSTKGEVPGTEISNTKDPYRKYLGQLGHKYSTNSTKLARENISQGVRCFGKWKQNRVD